jgi:nitrogen fixation protein NifB
MNVKVNTLLLPGINDTHIPMVAQKMAELGVKIQNVLPFIPVEGTDFAHITPPHHTYVAQIREKAAQYVPQMTHCGRCRADAFGFINKKSTDHYTKIKEIEGLSLNPLEKRDYIAVASEEGLLINKHLGQADELYIYKIENREITFIEKRKTPAPGMGDERWDKLCTLLSDCHTLLVSGIGPRPFHSLTNRNVKVFSLEGLIEEALVCLVAGDPLDHLQKRISGVCGGCNDKKVGCL